MTARQPRRTRRRISEPRTTLPRPETEDAALLRAGSVTPARSPARHREHHVTEDFSHVTRDLVVVAVVGAVALAFVFVMSFVVS